MFSCCRTARSWTVRSMTPVRCLPSLLWATSVHQGKTACAALSVPPTGHSRYSVRSATDTTSPQQRSSSPVQRIRLRVTLCTFRSTDWPPGEPVIGTLRLRPAACRRPRSPSVTKRPLHGVIVARSIESTSSNLKRRAPPTSRRFPAPICVPAVLSAVSRCRPIRSSAAADSSSATSAPVVRMA